MDAIFDYSVEDEVIGGLTTLGLDPNQIKYVVISHAHGDHVGGAGFLQKRGARIVMSEADWDLMDAANVTYAKPSRDVVATDGQKLTLGDTTVTLHVTPGHTLGTVSSLIPVKDGGRQHVAAYWGGTAFNWVRGPANYITPDRPARFWFTQYATSAQRFRDLAARAAPMSCFRTTPTSTAARPRFRHFASFARARLAHHIPMSSARTPCGGI